MGSQLYGLNFLQLYGLLYGMRQLQYEVVIHIRQRAPVPIEGRELPADMDCLPG